jgi:O-antigen/teichoic acid export membrane protein
MTVLLRHSVAYTVVASAIGSALVLIAQVTHTARTILPSLSGRYLAIALVLLPCLMFTGLSNGILVGIGSIKTANVVRLVQAVTTVGLIAGAVALDLGVFAVVVAVVIGAALATVLSAVAAGRHRELPDDLAGQADATWLRQQLHYGARDHLGNVVQFLNYRLDQFLVASIVNVTALGVYSVAVAVAELLWVFPQAAGAVIFSKSSRGTADEMNRFTPKVFAASVVVTVAAGLVLIVVGRPLITRLFGSGFDRAYTAMLLLLPGAVLLGPAKVLTNELAGRGLPGYNSMAAAVGMVLTIALDVALIPRWGINGAAVASSASYGVVAALAGYWFRKALRS